MIGLFQVEGSGAIFSRERQDRSDWLGEGLAGFIQAREISPCVQKDVCVQELFRARLLFVVSCYKPVKFRGMIGL